MAKLNLLGDTAAVLGNDMGATAFDDAVIRFFCEHARNKRVLDLGCVNHNPENYKSKFWLHKALTAVASHCVGLDIYEPGVKYLRSVGFDVIHGNAESFNLGKRFDVISAGEIIEHLSNPSGMLECVRRHLFPSGVLLLSTPNPWHWRFVVKSMLSPDVRPNPEHVAWYCKTTLKTLVARHDFVISEFAYASRYMRDWIIPLPKGIKHTTIMLAVRPQAMRPEGA